MKRTWIGTAAMVALGCAALLAQSSQNPTPTPGDQSQSSARSSQTGSITVTGCLNKGGAGAVGTSGSNPAEPAGGASAARPGANDWVLSNATMGSSSSSSSASPSPSTAGTSGSTYILDDSSNQLASHTGEKVEVTGTLASSSSGGAAAEPPSAGSAASSRTAANAQHIRVSSVKMISKDCSSK